MQRVAVVALWSVGTMMATVVSMRGISFVDNQVSGDHPGTLSQAAVVEALERPAGDPVADGPGGTSPSGDRDVVVSSIVTSASEPEGSVTSEAVEGAEALPGSAAEDGALPGRTTTTSPRSTVSSIASPSGTSPTTTRSEPSDVTSATPPTTVASPTTATTSPPATTAPPATTVAPPPQSCDPGDPGALLVGRTALAGSVVACFSSSGATLVSAIPAAGYTVRVGSRHPEVEVTFRNGDLETTVKSQRSSRTLVVKEQAG